MPGPRVAQAEGDTLGILVPDLTNPVTLSFIRGVQHVAQPHGYAVAIGDAQRDVGVERVQLEVFVGQRVAAVIVAGALQDPGNLSVLEADTEIVHSPATQEAHGPGEDQAIGHDWLGTVTGGWPLSVELRSLIHVRPTLEGNGVVRV